MTVLQNSGRLSPIAALFSMVTAPIQDGSSRYKAWEKQNEVRAELRRFTDRELADIGLSRSQIETMDFSEDA
jgi:uncharacterized protein YjiS (DUF1127 family)